VTTPLSAPLRFLIAAERRQRDDVDTADTDVVLLSPKDTGADISSMVRDALLLAMPLQLRCGAAACAAEQRVAFEAGPPPRGPWGGLAGLRAKLK